MLVALVDIADLLLTILTWVIIIQVVLSWLLAFNVLNTSSNGVLTFAVAIDRTPCELVLRTLKASSQLRMTWMMMIQVRIVSSRFAMSTRARSMALA